ncbi:unnamed protein product [Adineta ricciae]|uniref:RRM domain-containing protein n=1 Tax=Adineta ricciae TaxID=249248 RepID=A0A815A1I7_ADIRI|nr:unnamed protein product [Adineta ricciae]CAF1622625.1 unnamed protein product [Adineta ricciae]
MRVAPSDVRQCALIRGTRSSTTKEMVCTYCEKYGPISYAQISANPQGVIRGYNVVYKQEQSVNRFMDDRPHQIDGQSVKVRRCIQSDEEWRLTNKVIITTSDSSRDKQIFHEETLRDYFSKYGTVRVCQIDTYHGRPCAYLHFANFDRVDQLINDKPHSIHKIQLNVRKHIYDDKTEVKLTKKRRELSPANIEERYAKQRRSSTSKSSSDVCATQTSAKNKEINRLKIANEVLMQEVQSLISPSVDSPTVDNEILHLKAEYERLSTQLSQLRDTQQAELLNKLYSDVSKLFQQIKDMRQETKTFDDELFEKYTIEYILSLTEQDVKQRCEQLEKENQLLLLIKQNLLNK